MASELQEQRAELRRLLGAATSPLPWEWIAIDSKTLCLGTVGEADMGGHVLWTAVRCDACEKRDAPCMWPSETHSELIAKGMNALPSLLSALDRAETLRAFVLQLRTGHPRNVGRMVDAEDTPSAHCAYCQHTWDPWTPEHHSEWCVWGERLTAALESEQAGGEGQG